MGSLVGVWGEGNEEADLRDGMDGGAWSDGAGQGERISRLVSCGAGGASVVAVSVLRGASGLVPIFLLRKRGWRKVVECFRIGEAEVEDGDWRGKKRDMRFLGAGCMGFLSIGSEAGRSFVGSTLRSGSTSSAAPTCSGPSAMVSTMEVVPDAMTEA